MFIYPVTQYRIKLLDSWMIVVDICNELLVFCIGLWNFDIYDCIKFKRNWEKYIYMIAKTRDVPIRVWWYTFPTWRLAIMNANLCWGRKLKLDNNIRQGSQLYTYDTDSVSTNICAFNKLNFQVSAQRGGALFPLNPSPREHGSNNHSSIHQDTYYSKFQ